MRGGRRRLMASPAQRLAWVAERTHKKALHEAEESKAAAKWRQPSTLGLDDVEVPASFAKHEITRLWYLSHCGPDGHFQATPRQYSAFPTTTGPPTAPPLRRRIELMRRLAPLVLPRYASMIWRIAGWRVLLQVAADSLIGIIPAWGTFSQGKLVDAVQRSLYSADVPAEEIISLALWSIIASNARPLITVLLANNAQWCQDRISNETDRIHLKLHLDLDMPSSSNPIVSSLLQDCASFGYQGAAQMGGLAHLRTLVDSLSIFANVIASAFLVFTTLKAFSDFGVSSPFSTLFFVGLATFPTFFADAIRRFGLVATSERYYLWQQSANRAYTFFGIATSFAYKQEVLLFGLRDWIIESWAKFKEESDKVRGPDQELFGGSLMVTGVPENIIKDLLYLCLGLRFFSESITLGSLHIIQNSVSSVYWSISGVQNRIDETMNSVRAIAAFIGAQIWIEEQKSGQNRSVRYTPRVPAEGEKRGMKIEAKGLTFRYPTGKTDTLRNINLTIEAGETLAIVGVNGGGKSTLAKVLTGLYDYEGSLLIDGVEARTYQRESLHRYMTVCPQNFAVFPLSIRENIGIGQVEQIANDAAIMEAVRRGGAEEVVRFHGLNMTLTELSAAPNMGWDHPEQVGQPEQPPQKEPEQASITESKPNPEANGPPEEEKSLTESLPSRKPDPEAAPEKHTNGDIAPVAVSKPGVGSELAGIDKIIPPSVSLSGGQMQRVAISRAFMRANEATLVVLDEPSASLDARAEYELFQRIYALSRGDADDTRTTIYISHRFSTVRRADKIAVVEDGEIIELGSHKQLMELNGRYAEFFTLQVKAFSE